MVFSVGQPNLLSRSPDLIVGVRGQETESFGLESRQVWRGSMAWAHTDGYSSYEV